MEIPDKIFFKIGEVGKLLEVEPYVLRYWEREFLLNPKRSRSGQRLYRHGDVERLLRIKRLLHTEGYTIAGAKKVIARTAAGQVGVERTSERAGAPGSDLVVARDGSETASHQRSRDGASLESIRTEVEQLRRLIREARGLEAWGLAGGSDGA